MQKILCHCHCHCIQQTEKNSKPCIHTYIHTFIHTYIQEKIQVKLQKIPCHACHCIQQTGKNPEPCIHTYIHRYIQDRRCYAIADNRHRKFLNRKPCIHTHAYRRSFRLDAEDTMPCQLQATDTGKS